jgi:hypothetical protein
MPYDDTEFVDREFPAPTSGTATAVGAVRPGAGTGGRAPTREELDAQLTETQQRLAKLREAHEQLERAKSELEEMRRRKAEFQTGREEIRTALNRGIGLLEKAEFEARRDAEQMVRSLEGLRLALSQVSAVRDESWTESNWGEEIGKALTVIENAQMEWNGARIKWPVLSGETPAAGSSQPASVAPVWERLSFLQLCRLGLAFTWPLMLVGLIAVTVFALAIAQRGR